MPLRRLVIPDGQMEIEFSIQHGIRQKYVARGVDLIENPLVVFIAALEAEIHNREMHRRGELESAVGLHLRLEPMREAHMFADQVRQTFMPVRSHYEPQLQGAESATQRHSI